MSAFVKSCYIRSLEKSPSNIYLPDNEPVFVGRTPEIGVTDTKCSRRQVRLCANYAEAIVTVQQIGVHACGFDGFKTQRDVKFVARHNDRLELLYGKYAYEIEFNPPPRIETNPLKRRSCEPVVEIESKAKMLKLRDSMNNKKSRCDKEREDLSQDSPLSHASPSHNSDINNGTSIPSEESNVPLDISGTWDHFDKGELLIFTPRSIQHQAKMAAYDMDGTLIKTKSGSVFPKDFDDWRLQYPNVSSKLKELHANGYKIVIFTNQKGLSNPRSFQADYIDLFKKKIENVVRKIDVPIQVFIATGRTIYRKPSIGMWEILEKEKNGNIPIDRDCSFFVGDAAGRPSNTILRKRKDHSCADRLMAINLSIKFQTPEEHFLKQKAGPYNLPEFNPKSVWQTKDLYKPADAELIRKQQEIILMVGMPGSGKTHFAKTYLKDYGYVNRDSLNSMSKCVTVVNKYLSEGKSVVVDNTNLDPTSRQKFIKIAKHNLPIRCFVMTTSLGHIKHNNKFRQLIDTTHAKISLPIILSCQKTYVRPTLEEGFDEIIDINFIPNFRHKHDEKLYEMYLCED